MTESRDTLAYKILRAHLEDGELKAGMPITVRIDQTLTQDSTGTMVYLQLEALEVEKTAAEVSVAYIDHNTLQTGFENADDHAFIRSVAGRHGIKFSKPGGGICHQLHFENYGIPGKTLIGSDSHTPTGGGLGMIAIGAGGLDVAVAIAQGKYKLSAPKVLGVELRGELRPWVSAKDVILHILRELGVKGGVGKIVEYHGPGVASLSATDRATITNMGAELGATTSLFPSDENTKVYLASQGREGDWLPLSADEGAIYDESLSVDLSAVEPLAACPHSPDNVKTLPEIGAIKIEQVAIGSCTNSSYSDLMKAATILKGRRVHPDISLVISPGSASILSKLAKNGALADLIDAGSRIIENACGPCIGMGQSPESGAVSLRTFNRNFKGRSGTNDASVYLVSPETAALSAVTGRLTDGLREAAELGIELTDIAPETFEPMKSFLVEPPEGPRGEVIMGPNIKPFPRNTPLPEEVSGEVVLIAGDNITTDDIMPSDSRLLPYRSNIPFLAEYCFEKVDPGFSKRAAAARDGEAGGGFIIGGENYGQGSSREHAALAPLYLGVKAVIAKSFARIHMANLINSGIIPLTFRDPEDASDFSLGEKLCIKGVDEQLGNPEITLETESGKSIVLINGLNENETALLRASGKINLIKQQL